MSTGFPHLDEQIDTLDATVMNGKALYNVDAALQLLAFMASWERVIQERFDNGTLTKENG